MEPLNDMTSDGADRLATAEEGGPASKCRQALESFLINPGFHLKARGSLPSVYLLQRALKYGPRFCRRLGGDS